MLVGRRLPRTIQLTDLPLPDESETPEVQGSFDGLHEVHRGDELEVRLHVAESTLAQWKAIEMFKVSQSILMPL